MWSRSLSGAGSRLLTRPAVADVVVAVLESLDPVSGHQERKHLSLDLRTIELDNDRADGATICTFFRTENIIWS